MAEAAASMKNQLEVVSTCNYLGHGIFCAGTNCAPSCGGSVVFVACLNKLVLVVILMDFQFMYLPM